MQYVDLSVTIDKNTPVYPGDPLVQLNPAGQLEKDGYSDHLLAIGTHVGTHIDAPMHMIAGGKSLNQVPLERFIGRGKYIKVDGSFDLEVVRQSGIQEGDIVIFDTGMSALYHESKYFEEYPAMSAEVAEYLVDMKIKMVGVDTCSVDNQDGFPIHKTLLGGDVLIIENLTNVSELMNKDFTVYALPLNLQIDGSPARVIAQLS